MFKFKPRSPSDLYSESLMTSLGNKIEFVIRICNAKLNDHGLKWEEKIKRGKLRGNGKAKHQKMYISYETRIYVLITVEGNHVTNQNLKSCNIYNLTHSVPYDSLISLILYNKTYVPYNTRKIKTFL